MEGESRDHATLAVQIEPRIFWPGLLLVLALAVPLAVFPEAGGRIVDQLLAFTTSRFGWLYLLAGIVSLGFLLWLALSPYGRIKLGAPEDLPEFSTPHWVAMLFCAGIGIAIVNWAFVEPLYLISKPPLGLEPRSQIAAQWAHMYAQFHWGLIPWALYCVPAIPIAYSLYVRREPFVRFSTASRGVLGRRADGWLGHLMDVMVVFATVGGVGTSLGLAVPLVSALFGEILGIEDSFALHVLILGLWTGIFSVSVYKGLDRGIKRLSDLNVVLALGLLGFTLLVGPITFILSMWTNSIGLLLDNFFRISFWLDPLERGGFPETWTIFYWAWWIAYAPMMGLFVARISRGRTVRQVILGQIWWGSIGCWTFFAIWGGYSIYLDVNHLAPVSQLLEEQGIPAAVIGVLKTLPGAAIVLGVFTLLCFVFLATTLDSAAYILASVSTRELTGYEEPARWNRLLWAFVLAVVGVGLLAVGGLDTARTSTVLGALPMIPALIVLCWSLLRWLREDYGASLRAPIYALEQTGSGSRVVVCEDARSASEAGRPAVRDAGEGSKGG